MLLINRIFTEIFDNLSGHNSFPMTAHGCPTERPQEPLTPRKAAATAKASAKTAEAAKAHRPAFG